MFLPIAEVQIVEPHGIGRLLKIPILLIINGHAIPVGRSWTLIVIESRSLSIQRDGLKQQVIVRCALHRNRQVVPCIRHWIARNACGMPGLAGIVPNIPLVPTRDAALMAPDKGQSIHELIDVELQRLRNAGILNIKIHVINEVMQIGHHRAIGVGQTLR